MQTVVTVKAGFSSDEEEGFETSDIDELYEDADELF